MLLTADDNNQVDTFEEEYGENGLKLVQAGKARCDFARLCWDIID